jgi:hypothetical protein
VFGHVHRLDPLPGDLDRRWRGAQGRPCLLNTGSWVYEPLLVHNATAQHPYWPGGAVTLENNGTLRVVGLLATSPPPRCTEPASSHLATGPVLTDLHQPAAGNRDAQSATTRTRALASRPRRRCVALRWHGARRHSSNSARQCGLGAPRLLRLSRLLRPRYVFATRALVRGGATGRSPCARNTIARRPDCVAGAFAAMRAGRFAGPAGDRKQLSCRGLGDSRRSAARSSPAVRHGGPAA